MQRLAVAALLVSACGTTDDRPPNLDYITETILAALSRGTAVCHSSFRQEDGFVFDTVDHARATFQGDVQLIGFDDSDPTKTPGLIINLTVEQANAPRMPYDQPLPDADVDLIERWLRDGAPGVCNGVRACLGNQTIPCEPKKGAYVLSELGRTANVCINGCRDGACL